MVEHRLTVLCASSARPALRRLSRFLEAFGYRVLPFADAASAIAAMETDRPDFLLLDLDLDDPQCRELCLSAGGNRRLKYVYTFLAAANPRVETVTQAVKMGVDDFLSRPFVYGELLARLRAGARVVEYERRVRDQAGVDALTGLQNAAAFEAALSQPAEGPRSCVLLEGDQLSGIRRQYGHSAGDSLLETLAASLDELCPDHQHVARLSDDRFAVLLEGHTEDQACEWAEIVQLSLVECEFTYGELPLRTTITVGVAGMADDDDLLVMLPATLMDRAAAALEQARRSGRNCVATYGEYARDHADWLELAEGNGLFSETLARQVMTPCTMTLRDDDTAALARELFDKSALAAIPVVGADEKLRGVMLPTDREDPRNGETEENAADSFDPRQPLSELFTAEIPRFAEETEFSAILDHFAESADEVAVIVSDDSPVGLVTRQSLLTLIEPLGSSTYAANRPVAPTSDYLRVSECLPMPTR